MAKETLSGKITVITGGARGIGYAVAERLLEEGAKVAFCALRQESVDTAMERLKGKGDVLGVAADVSKYEEVKRFIAEVVREFGGVDILVNNAGIRTYRSVAELEPAEWDRMLGVNLSAAFYCSHEVLPIFRRQGYGDIVNISSLSSMSAFAGGAGYNASKAGLNGLSDATMLDHRYDNVRVCQVMPGSTDTEFNAKEAGDWKVSPDDIACAVAMLLRMPRRCTVSRIDVKPTQPPRKAQ
jgi:3-oxoacyl-[acyl-carrier protein] reductase